MRERIRRILVEVCVCVCKSFALRTKKKRDGSGLLFCGLFPVVDPFSKHRVIGVKD